jgi:endonuclease YncB( thermonuclease family)
MVLARDVRRMRTVTSAGKRTFEGQTRLARVVSVYDGDTIKVITRLDSHEKHREYSVRLMGIDTPEMAPRMTTPDRDLHKAAAVVARDRLAALIPAGAVVQIRFEKEDVYGRLLGTVHTLREGWWTYKPRTDACAWMLDEKLALPLSGGSKEGFTKEFLEAMVR